LYNNRTEYDFKIKTILYATTIVITTIRLANLVLSGIFLLYKNQKFGLKLQIPTFNISTPLSETLMKDYIAERVTDIATYLLKNKCTVREVAKVYCVSKSTAHKDLAERLPQIDKQLYNDVYEILRDNWDDRYIRGGEATKRKYKSE